MKIVNFITWIATRLTCLIEGHRWQVVTRESVFCQNCDKWLSKQAAQRYFDKWMEG